MSINIENEVKESFDCNYEDLLKRVVEACLDYENCPYEAEVNILLTDNEQIQEIFLNWRKLTLIPSIQKPVNYFLVILLFPLKKRYNKQRNMDILLKGKLHFLLHIVCFTFLVMII